MAKQTNIETTGVVTEALGGANFRVELDINKSIILAQPSGRMRKFYIRVLPGDRVKLEMSPYDMERGRIISRIDTTPKPTQPVGKDKKKKK